MTGISERLAKLSKWDDMARRAQRAEPPAADAPFREVVEAVGRVVRRHPGMSVVVSVGDETVQVAERDGAFEATPVQPPPATPPVATADRSPATLTSDLARMLRRNPNLFGPPPRS